MAHAENSIVINRPVTDVFDYLLDGNNNPKWRPGVLDIRRDTATLPGLGVVYKQGLKGPGGRIDGDYKITRLQANQLIEFQVVAGPARPMGTYTLEPSSSGTKVLFVLDFKPTGLAKLMDGIIAKTMQAEVATLSNLKSVLEATCAGYPFRPSACLARTGLGGRPTIIVVQPVQHWERHHHP